MNLNPIKLVTGILFPGRSHKRRGKHAKRVHETLNSKVVAVKKEPPPPTVITQVKTTTRQAPITDIDNLPTNIRLTSNQTIIKIFTGIVNKEKIPAIVDNTLNLYRISEEETSGAEDRIIEKILTALRKLRRGEEPEITRITRAVFDSYQHRLTNRDSLQEQRRQSSAHIETMLKNAISRRATDIHLEVKNGAAVIRERIFGELRPVQKFDADQALRINNALWSLYVNMQYAESDTALDGRFEYLVKANRWLCRVSLIASKPNQELSIAIRLRDMHEKPKLEDLGYHESQLEILHRARNRKGMILFIGSVNSGKSTTQNALMDLRPKNSKNLEISDQIEVDIDVFCQMQFPTEGTDEEIAEAKKRMMRVSTRHDVDYIAINEIRDKDTAAMAASMLLQGVSATSSIHGSSWCDAINRLSSPEDLAVSPSIIHSESFIGLIVVQSLIGTLCDQCKRDTCMDTIMDKHFRNNFGTESYQKMAFQQPEGCDHCKYIGVRGRTLISETLPMEETNRHFLKDTTKPQYMRDWQLENNVLTQHEHSFGKILDASVDPLKAESRIGPFSQYNIFDNYVGYKKTITRH